MSVKTSNTGASEPTERKDVDWVKFGQLLPSCFVGKDVLAMGLGCHILFVNYATKSESIYKANGETNGDGVACLAGHPYTPAFAFAEKCSNPRIIVRSYPDNSAITKMHNGSPGGYVAMVFTEGDYLFTLTSFPIYKVQLWCWRTGEKLTEHDTNVVSDEQHLCATPGTPLLVCQRSFNPRRLIVWEMFVCKGIGRLNPTEILLCPPGPPHHSPLEMPEVTWGSDGHLYALEENGDISQANLDAQEFKTIIEWQGEAGTSDCSFCRYKTGFILSGPNADLVCYMKTGNDWETLWVYTPDIPFSTLLWSDLADMIIGWNESGFALEFVLDSESGIPTEFNTITRLDRGYVGMDLLHPAADYVVTLDRAGQLSIWHKSDGSQAAIISHVEDTVCMTSSTKYPFVVIGTKNGCLIMYNLFYPEEPKLLAKISLGMDPIEEIRFTDSGDYMTAVNLTNGELFVVKAIPGQSMDVEYFMAAGHQLAKFCVSDDSEYLNIVALLVTSTTYIAGNRLLVYGLPRNPKTARSSQKYFLNLMSLYTSVHACYDESYGSHVVYAVPHMTTMIHLLNFQRNTNKVAKIVNTISSGHQLRNIHFDVDSRHVTTCGMGGLVFVHNLANRKESVIMMHHHRMDLGALRAFVDPYKHAVISLGRNGTLICTKIKILPQYEREIARLRALAVSPAYEKMMIENETTGFYNENYDQTWLDVLEERLIREEYGYCLIQKKEIEDGIEFIRGKVVELLEANYEAPPEETLPIQAFNLDLDASESMIRRAKEERDNVVRHTNALIKAQDEVTEWIKDTTYRKMEVAGQSIMAIYETSQVDNYTLMPQSATIHTKYLVSEMYKEIDVMINAENLFDPWCPKTDEVLHADMDRKPVICDMDTVRLTRLLTDEEIDEEDEEMPHFPSGSTLAYFIEAPTKRVPQVQIVTATQMATDTVFIQREIVLLRYYFNEVFVKMMHDKERVMDVILERNARLRKILEEQNILAELRGMPQDIVPIEISDPTWGPPERPATIIKVEDYEVSVLRYVSPSQQALIDQQAEEDERMRLLLLKDDFRERALWAMMYGVLEVLWEDEIKKSPPLPKCMKEKKPEEYNEDDLRQIKDYEDKLAFLRSERDKYRKMLEAEFKKLTQTIKDGIKKFNKQLSDLLVHRLRVESAISQENLKVCRYRQHIVQRQEFKKREEQQFSLIHDTEEEIVYLQNDVTVLLERMRDVKRHYDQMVQKDKMLDKTFKMNFSDYSPVIQDQSYKLFKKRPKWHHIHGVSSALLMQVAHKLGSNDPKTFLPNEGLEFVQGLEEMDSFANAPKIIDETVWKSMIKYRVQKIESEFRIKALALDVAEAEQTCATYQKKLAKEKDKLHKRVNQLKELRMEQIADTQDLEVQIVFPSGQVEIALTGKLSDFDDAILITKSDVEIINEIIKKAGELKLKCMIASVKNKRKIMSTEWDHKCLRMEIEDLENEHKMIERVQVTKDVQDYLKRTYLGKPESVGPLALEREIKAIQKKMMKILEDVQKEYNDMEQLINRKKAENAQLDKKIAALNVDVNEKQLLRDREFEAKHEKQMKDKMAIFVTRSKLCSCIQKQHASLVELQTELELLRLKTYPSFNWKCLLPKQRIT